MSSVFDFTKTFVPKDENISLAFKALDKNEEKVADVERFGIDMYKMRRNKQIQDNWEKTKEVIYSRSHNANEMIGREFLIGLQKTIKINLSAVLLPSYFVEYVSMDHSKTDTFYHERSKKIKECIVWLRKHKVAVGIPSTAPARSKYLFRIIEHGSPINNLPPRPFLDKAYSEHMMDWEMQKYFLLACEAAADGDLAGVKAGFNAAGQAGANYLKHLIRDEIIHFAPLAEITLDGGWMKNKVSGKPFYVQPKNGETPLVNTGQFVDSFGYEILDR